MSIKPLNSERPARLSQPPLRTYEVPGGPYAKDLAEVTVTKLAEIERGGPNDNTR